jgi:histidinol-phosphate phosphatase family protein
MAPVGRRSRHVVTASAAVLALAGALARRRRVAALAAAAWALGTAELAFARIVPGPRDAGEIRRMTATSVAIPLAAAWHSVKGLVAHGTAAPWRGVPDLVLLDRDGTVVHDVPYNGDPSKVVPKEGVLEGLARLRAEGIRLGLVTNQSGVASGRITVEQVAAVNDKVVELLGPLDTLQVCPHGPESGCRCRKPAPGMLVQACAELGVDPARTVLIGDIGADVQAATAAGVSGILVPTEATRTDEVRAAAHRCATFERAIDDVLSGRW